MNEPFFPDVSFGWIFVAVLLGSLLVAAYIDFRWFKIPKWVTLPLLGLGIVFNVVRGVWLASNASVTWLLPATNASMGALDGLLFSLAGSVAAFGFFFVLWMLRAMGGGDVKLFASIGAWAGPYLTLWIWIISVVCLALLSLMAMFLAFLAGQQKKTLKALSSKGMRSAIKSQREGREVPLANRLMSYSLSIAVAAILVLLWALRYDLQLATPPVPPISIY